MNIMKKFFTIFIVLFLNITSSYGQDQIVYLDFENIISNTKAGKLILSKLEKSKKTALSNFEKKRKKFKKS